MHIFTMFKVCGLVLVGENNNNSQIKTQNCTRCTTARSFAQTNYIHFRWCFWNASLSRLHDRSSVLKSYAHWCADTNYTHAAVKKDRKLRPEKKRGQLDWKDSNRSESMLNAAEPTVPQQSVSIYYVIISTRLHRAGRTSDPRIQIAQPRWTTVNLNVRKWCLSLARPLHSALHIYRVAAVSEPAKRR